MRRKQFIKSALLLFALTGGANAVQAGEVNVSNQTEFKTAWNTAVNATDAGETTIIMAAGDYNGTDIRWSQLEIPMSQSVTLKAAEGAAVSLNIKVRSNETARCGSLTFDGIKLIPSDNYFLDLGNNTSDIGDIVFRNCEITSDGSFGRSLIYGGNAANTINSIVFENCRIHDCCNSYVFVRPNHQIKSFTAVNNTLYNYGGEGFLDPQTLYPGTDFTCTFCNNTMYKWSRTNRNYYLLNLSKYANGQTENSATIIVNDNIFWGFNEDGTPDSRIIRYDATVGKVEMKNNLLYGWGVWYGERCTDKTVSNLTVSDVDASLVENEAFKVPPFADVTTGDFTLDITNYPKLATCSSVGSLIGAPRWGTYQLTVGTAKAATLTLPFTTSIPDDVELYTLTYTSGDKATATPVESTLPANTPVLVNAEAGTYTFNATGEVLATATDVKAGALTGAYILTDVPTGSYVLQNHEGKVGFYKVSDSAPQQINPFRAYLTATTSNARMITIDFGNETTGITTICQETINNNCYYDLSGRSVERPTSGLYILNGRKILVK